MEPIVLHPKPQASPPDLIGLFERYSTGLPSCPLYREWCGIVLIAGALERRVWATYGRMQTFPNLFVMLVGPPGAGKGVINCVRDLWSRTTEPNQAGDSRPIFNIGLKSYTKASLADDLKESRKTFIPPIGTPLVYHSLLLASEEFPVLFPRFDLEFLAFLSDMWNADVIYSERRRTSEVRSLSIENPLITALLGYQPAVMATTLPSQAWDQGFMRRTIMVWNGTPELKSLFDSDPFDQNLEDQICRRLTSISKLWGQMRWEREAAELIDQWHQDGGPPKPTHMRLQSYCNSRSHLAIKLAIVASVSESEELIIRHRHMEKAIAWLLQVEALMPEIFRSMVGDSDSHLLIDTHNMLMALYARQKPKPIHGSLIWTYLKDRAPSHKISFLVQTLEKSGLIERDPGTDFWRPKIGASRAQ